MPTQTDDLTRTSATLLARVRDLDDQASWQRFYDRYRKLVYTLARRYGFMDAAAEDVVQETFVTVSRHMPRFRYDRTLGSFKTWLVKIARCRVFDALRRTHCKHQDQYAPREIRLSTTIMESCPAPEEGTLEQMEEGEWCKDLLDRALCHLRRTADAREVQMFYLYVIKNVSAKDVALKFGVKPGKVYATERKLTPRLIRELKRLGTSP